MNYYEGKEYMKYLGNEEIGDPECLESASSLTSRSTVWGSISSQSWPPPGKMYHSSLPSFKYGLSICEDLL